MENLKQAYEILDSISNDAGYEEIKQKALKAYECSPSCIEAAIVLSKLENDFIDKERLIVTSISSLIELFENNKESIVVSNINKARLELGSLYYEYGMYQKSLTIFADLKSNDLAKYKLMNLYAYFEDKRIDDLYKEFIKNSNDLSFVRLAFPYLVYEYKQARFSKVNELFMLIDSKNPNIKKAINNEIKEEEQNDSLTKEAFKVLKNNSVLVNSCPYLLNYLASL